MNPRSIVRVVMLAGLASCRAETWSPAVPERIEVIQGAAQRGTPGIPLDTLILARVVDGNGNSVSGVPISWEVLGGAGSVDPVEGETPDDLAGAVWTPGFGADPQRLLLSSPGVESVVIEADAPVFTAAQFAVGGEFGCGVDTEAATWCWGSIPGSGATFENSRLPVRVEGAPAFAGVVAGYDHVCGLTPSGEVWCWGMNYSGQLGNGTTSSYPTGTPAPLRVTGLPSVASLEAGEDGTCAVDTAGGLWCWGRVAGGAVTPTPTIQFAGTVFERIALGAGFGCGVVAGGQVACWGRNDLGQLGRGSTGGSSTTLLPIASSFVATALDAGAGGACAISSGRDVVCWGLVSGITGHAFDSPNLGVPSRSNEDSPALRLTLGYYCGAIWQSPASPRLLCPGGFTTDIEGLPMITGASFGSAGDLCLAVGTGGLYCKTYSDQAFGPPFDFRGTGVPAPLESAP